MFVGDYLLFTTNDATVMKRHSVMGFGIFDHELLVNIVVQPVFEHEAMDLVIDEIVNRAAKA